MSVKITFKKIKGGINANITCERCGGPIVDADKYGMRCKKDCFKKENRRADKEIKKLISRLMKL